MPWAYLGGFPGSNPSPKMNAYLLQEPKDAQKYAQDQW